MHWRGHLEGENLLQCLKKWRAGAYFGSKTP
jgi:hypothetical protein